MGSADIVAYKHTPKELKGCEEFLKQYTKSQTFNYLAVITTTIMNQVMLWLMNISADWEVYTSITEKNSSILLKTFLAIVFNFCIPQLIASGYAPEPEAMRVLRLMQGAFNDFSHNWFAVVGTYFISSFFMDGFVLVLLKLGRAYVYVPMLRQYFRFCTW